MSARKLIGQIGAGLIIPWGRGFIKGFLKQLAMGEDNAPTQPLDWMAGHWCTDSGAKSVEETWLPPRGKVLVGLGRTYTADRTVGFEFLRIAEPGNSGVEAVIRRIFARVKVRFELSQEYR